MCYACLNKKYSKDYKTERIEALKNIFLDVIPTDHFYEWLKSQGKEGAQIKFPRVLKGKKLEDWLTFVKNKSLVSNFEKN